MTVSNITNIVQSKPTFIDRVAHAFIEQNSPGQRYPCLFDEGKHEVVGVAPKRLQHLQALYDELQDTAEEIIENETNQCDERVHLATIINQLSIVNGLIKQAINDFAEQQSKNSGLFMITENWMIVSVRPDTNVNHAPSGENINKQHSRFSTLQANAA